MWVAWRCSVRQTYICTLQVLCIVNTYETRIMTRRSGISCPLCSGHPMARLTRQSRAQKTSSSWVSARSGVCMLLKACQRESPGCSLLDQPIKRIPILATKQITCPIHVPKKGGVQTAYYKYPNIHKSTTTQQVYLVSYSLDRGTKFRQAQLPDSHQRRGRQ